MLELSIHVLDIVQNSVAAGATRIEIHVTEDLKRDLMTIEIIDNGKAMDSEMLDKVTDPFTTTKQDKEVGLGLALISQAAKEAGGGLEVKSVPGQGTTVTASFMLSSIDRMPLGDMKSTILSLVFGSPEIDFAYMHKKGIETCTFDTRDVRKMTGGQLFSDARTIRLVREILESQLEKIRAK